MTHTLKTLAYTVIEMFVRYDDMSRHPITRYSKFEHSFKMRILTVVNCITNSLREREK